MGEAAVDFIRQFKVDIGIVGVSSIESDGTLRDYDFREVKVTQTIMSHSREVWMAAEYESDENLANEISQLLYHIQVLMLARGIDIEDVYEKL